jgi:hypothetical protein
LVCVSQPVSQSVLGRTPGHSDRSITPRVRLHLTYSCLPTLLSLFSDPRWPVRVRAELVHPGNAAFLSHSYKSLQEHPKTPRFWGWTNCIAILSGLPHHPDSPRATRSSPGLAKTSRRRPPYALLLDQAVESPHARPRERHIALEFQGQRRSCLAPIASHHPIRDFPPRSCSHYHILSLPSSFVFVRPCHCRLCRLQFQVQIHVVFIPKP